MIFPRPPTARELAESQDVREEFRRRTGGPLPRALRGDAADLIFPPLYCGDADHGPAMLLSSARDLPAPAGRGAQTPNPPSCSLTQAMPPGRGFSDDLHALQGRTPEQVEGSWSALRLVLLSAAAVYLLASLGLALAALAGLFTNDT